MLLAKTFVGIDDKSFELLATRSSTSHTSLAQLVELACTVGLCKVFKIDGPAPVVFIVFLRTAVRTIDVDADFRIVEVLAICHYRDDRQGHLATQEQIRLRSGAGRKVTIAEEFGTNDAC